MNHWQQLNLEDRLDILNITSARTGLPADVIEKDWWVTATLYALSKTKYFPLMSFKGGTSLSKGYGLINRFSEDIDISIARQGVFSISNPSGNQLNKVRRKARHYVIRELPLELDAAFKEMGLSGYSIKPETTKLDRDGSEKDLTATTNPSTIFVIYDSIIHKTPEYFDSRVKIEIGCMNLEEPVEDRNLKSFLSTDMKGDEDMDVNFPTVVPSRTFIEKIFLLHEEFQKPYPRSKRMSRHLYDLEKLMDTSYGHAIEDKELYENIRSHRSIFNKMEYVDYNSHQYKTLSFIPPSSIISEWEKDYDSLKSIFIYDANPLSFPDLISRMNELQARIRKIK
ncbi:MAG: nucleotidyl transferase AbiEii/AbiGii toxin family protein [Muribaculaceae bacterium]|nr:nucleotidyl transferase AbiEii/AbiGii toxin family protein [Muribaculaceae bacterium]